MIGTPAPAADRSWRARVLTSVPAAPTAVTTQVTGFGAVTQEVMSLPPMETVMRPIDPLCALMNASAAAA